MPSRHPARLFGFLALMCLSTAWAVRAAEDKAAVIARMTADLTFLASDECEGRGPGTAGIDKAAEHIAAAFRAAGLQGAMPDGSYFQPFTVRSSPTLGQNVSVTLTGPEGPPTTLQLNDEFQPMGLSGSGTAEGPIVFVGYGITSSERPAYDDYKDVDVDGKVVLMIRRTPRFSDSERPFADDQTVTRLAALTTKFFNATKHKAAGVLLVNDASEQDDHLPDFRYSAAGTPTGVPAVHVKRSLADRMLRAALGKSLAELEAAIDRDLKPASAPLPGWSAKLAVSIERPQIPVKNVIGMLPGAGPLANETVVIGAHYDHLGYGGAGSLAGSVKAIHHGADDNASGTTAVIELARRFGAMPNRQGRRLVFMAFSAEEMGLLGSAHYVDKPLFPLENTVAMLNLDMVGRMTDDPDSGQGKLEVGGTGSAKEFDALIDQINTRHSLDLKKSRSGIGPSDHTSFYLKGVPVYFFFTGYHPDYHKPTDTADRINFTGLAKVVDLVEDLAQHLATVPTRPEFVKGAGSPMGTVRGNVPRLGIMPGNYADDADGVLVGSVTKDGPADKGGIREGDRIVAIAGKPVKNVTAYMTILGEHKPGEPVEITVIRMGERMTMKVVPQ